ncbi:hypothetical protein K5M33_22880 [Chromobacterium vaccinii]|nr:hypothetical protein [Chromobacterium vaccinii]MBX9359553.1 hypothetical protein [Chromobacterium vaccinii]
MSSYGGYIDRLSRKVEARLADIEAIFNFDLGSEFEVAMCALLEDILPAKFGVCRGFVITEDGRSAGDDLIIYDKMSCPMLRAGIGRQYSIKEQIPVEAVYAYIECKHSIANQATVEKAILQTKNVKELILSRRSGINPEYEKDGPIYNGKVRDWPRSHPPIRNQPFCAIFTKTFDPSVAIPNKHQPLSPDLLVLGPNHIATQSVVLGPDGIKGSLFYDDKYWAGLRVESAIGNAFGLGLVTLLQALNWIELEPMDWTGTLNATFSQNLFKPK